MNLHTFTDIQMSSVGQHAAHSTTPFESQVCWNVLAECFDWNTVCTGIRRRAIGTRGSAGSAGENHETRSADGMAIGAQQK